MAKRAKAATTRAGSDLFGKALPFFDAQTIYCGDNLEKLRQMPDGCVDLVYIDPPFNSNRNYEVFWGETKEKRAFDDRHESTKAYIEFMRPRCVELRRVLKATGSFYYHCDWHADGYIRVMLDQIFGDKQFNTQIIWRRTAAKSQSFKTFPNNHDSIFFYTKSDDFIFNRLFTPHSPERIKQHYNNIEPDTGRRYSLDNLTAEGTRNGSSGMPWRGIDIASKGNHWKYTIENLELLDAAGKIYWPAKVGGMPRLKRYLDEQEGVAVDSVWADIPPLNSQAKEALGYPTQKPLPLLERIIKASSNPDDVVLDAFCGCGTALVAAQKLDRRWIGIDVSPTACRVMARRLEEACGLRQGKDFTVRDMPHDEKFLRRIPHFEFENWAVIALGGIPNSAKVGDMGIDGRIYPVAAVPKKGADKLDFMDHWYPIQVKQKDKAGRPDIDSFEAVMMREDRTKGFFVSFDYTADAETEIRAFFRRTGKAIVALTVREILDEELAMRLA
jgi:DNA modification methylase